MEEKKLGLGNVISASMGLVVATSCLLSLAEGASSIGAAFIIAMVYTCYEVFFYTLIVFIIPPV